jgi:S1-C subfamily serine protease
MRKVNLIILFLIIAFIMACDIPSDGGLLSGEEKINGILDDPKEEPKKNNFIESQETTDVQSIKDGNASVFEKVLAGSVTIHPLNRNGTPTGVASGVIISSKYIATNFHVVENAESFEITMNSNNETIRSGKLFKVDEAHDLAIIEVMHENKNIIRFSLDAPKIGDDVIVAGSPSGLNGTVSKGIVSAYRKAGIYDFDLIQIDAPISPGSSGGPVVNKDAYLIGISVGGLGEGNLNFVVPVKYIQRLLE